MARSINYGAHNKFLRKESDRSFIRQIHIYTEGSVTEPEYLKIIKETILSNSPSQNTKFKINIKPSNSKSSPKNIRKAIRNEVQHFGNKKFNEVWVLLDKDDWDTQEICLLKDDKQISKSSSKFNVLISTPKFELWLILHFENGFGIATSSDVDRHIKKHIPGYDKHCNKIMFTQKNIFDAIERAKQLKKLNTPTNTDVYILIEYMFSLINN